MEEGVKTEGNKTSYTHPRGGKQWLGLFSAVYASSVPKRI